MKWIVVGAGSGGCVAARRLHDAGHEVVVLESGPTLLPGAVPAGIDADDSFAALAEPGRLHTDVVAVRSYGQAERPYLRGNGVGGSSAVNSMVALRGDDDLYRSWGWTDVDAAFDRILVPFERPALLELGRLDRRMLEASPHAEVVPLTRHDGRRVTAAEAYLWPCLSSSRMTVVANEVVDVVSFDGGGRAATGVRLANGGALAADAVVVAAGAIHTPSILLRSSVRATGVGDSLMDHPAAALMLRLESSGIESDDNRGLSTATVIDADPIQILALNHLGATSSSDEAMLMVALMRPNGRGGKVRLRSDDPFAAPVVEFDLLSDSHDVQQLRNGVRMAIDLLDSDPFSKIVADVFIDDQGNRLDAIDDDLSLDRWLRATAVDYVHASSSCSQATGLDGLVNEHEALYVCDASAFPSIPNVNTHLPTMMLAERFTAGWLR
jgi:choline dehydrogenase-like flavoprotein